MLTELRTSDAEILTRVVNTANEVYLKESRVSKKSSFGIIPILAAHKKLSSEYALRKDQIYNWIMLITKHYNPKTTRQWISAIEDLTATTQREKQSRRFDLPKQVNSSLSSLLNLNETSKPTRDSNSFYHQKKASSKYFSYVDEKQIKHDQSLNILPFSSKMHYVSFEPAPQNKQNINSDNYRDMVQHTKISAEQSFIRNLQNSPFINSKVTYHTKDYTQLEEKNQEWELMKSRADIFYSVNNKFKGFAALLANFETYQSYKEAMRKATKGVKKIKFQRFIENCVKLSEVKKEKKRRQIRTKIYYEGKVKEKIFNIFKILFSLKISPRKSISVQNFNQINFEFIISLMFFFTSDTSSPRNMKNMPNKFDYFKNIGDYTKLQIILSNFTNNPKVTKEQISHIFELQKRAFLKKCFVGLKKEGLKYNSKITEVKNERRKKVLSEMQNILENKKRKLKLISEFQQGQKKKVQHRCFKSIYEIVLSKKIYQKRIRYLELKSIDKNKKSFLLMWRSALYDKLMKKKNFLENTFNLVQVIKKNILKQPFLRLMEKYKMDLIVQRQVNFMKEKELIKTIFYHLKERVDQKKKFIEIREKNQKNMQNKVIQILKKKSSLSKSVKIVKKFFQKRIGREIVKNLFFQKNQKEIINSKKNNQTQRFLKQIRLNYKLNKEEEQEKLCLFEKKKFSLKISLLYENLQSILNEKIRREEKEENGRKGEQLTKIHNFKRKINFFISLESRKEQRKQYEEKINEIKLNYLKKKEFHLLNYLSMKRQEHKKITMIQQSNMKSIGKQFLRYMTFAKKEKDGKEFLQKKNLLLAKKIFVIFQEQRKVSQIKIVLQKEKYRTKRKSQVFRQLLKNREEMNIKTSEIVKICANRLKVDGMKDFLEIISNKINNQEKFKKLGGKLFIRRLRINKKYQTQKRQKKVQLQEYKKIQFLTKLRENKDLPELAKTYRNYNDLGMKIIWFNRLRSQITRKILNRKMEYMALKRRAMQLMKLGFSGIFLQLKHEKRQLYKNKRTSRPYEHFSTQYSSI